MAKIFKDADIKSNDNPYMVARDTAVVHATLNSGEKIAGLMCKLGDQMKTKQYEVTQITPAEAKSFMLAPYTPQTEAAVKRKCDER